MTVEPVSAHHNILNGLLLVARCVLPVDHEAATCATALRVMHQSTAIVIPGLTP